MSRVVQLALHVDEPSAHVLLPPGPLVEAVERELESFEGVRTHDMLLADLGTSRRQLYRWRAGQHVTLDTAEQVAAAMGLHPVELLTDDW